MLPSVVTYLATLHANHLVRSVQLSLNVRIAEISQTQLVLLSRPRKQHL